MASNDRRTRADWERISLILVLTVVFIAILLLMMFLIDAHPGEIASRATGAIWQA